MVANNHIENPCQPWPRLFADCLKRLPEEPGWLKDCRRENWQQFTATGFPSPREEDWKYTDLSPLRKLDMTGEEMPEIRFFQETAAAFQKNGMINLICINGFFLKDQWEKEIASSVVEIVPLGETAQQCRERFCGTEAKGLAGRNIFSSLTQALFPDGLAIRIAPQMHSPAPIHIVHLTQVDKPAVVCPRIVIEAGESSQMSIIERHVSGKNAAPYLTAPYTTITLAECAKLNYCRIQDEAQNAYHMSNTVFTLDSDAALDSFFLTAGLGFTRNNLAVRLAKPGAQAAANGLCVLKGEQLCDNHTFIDHSAPETTSVQTYKSIVFDAARNVFNGRILVRPDAQKTNSYQINKNLLMGEHCRVDTKPQLEIFADDVKCNHGATVGQLTEDEIFYLETRGIDRPRAVTMLANGFADDVVALIKDPAIETEVYQTLHAALPGF